MPRRKKKRNTTKVGATARKAGRPSTLQSVSLEALEAELRRREDEVASLHEQRNQLVAQLEELDRQILNQGGSRTMLKRRGRPAKTGRRGRPAGTGRRGRPPKSAAAKASTGAGGRRKRPRNRKPLVEVLGEVLEGRTLSVSEAAEAAKSAGYKTTSKTFNTIVNQALLTNTDKFRKVGRGQYTGK